MPSKSVTFTLLLLMMTSLTGCVGEEEPEIVAFPTFSAIADDGETYDNQRMSGGAFIVVFSAEWCNNPCHTSMFTIWEAIPELTVLVMSTDPAENASGITLQDWHEAANAFDDDDSTGDTGVTLTTYAFMKGVEAGQELGVTSPGTVMFVNADGYITATKVGILEEPQEVLDLWETAQ